ncbi:hypothetical protein GGR54DRAFT_546215 [Hypoxylon sp. NC1633]|nr:hypothetical protein GGR54DRAFT_546215 [Hypoxylon sp. NC1633]
MSFAHGVGRFGEDITTFGGFAAISGVSGDCPVRHHVSILVLPAGTKFAYTQEHREREKKGGALVSGKTLLTCFSSFHLVIPSSIYSWLPAHTQEHIIPALFPFSYREGGSIGKRLLRGQYLFYYYGSRKLRIPQAPTPLFLGASTSWVACMHAYYTALPLPLHYLLTITLYISTSTSIYLHIQNMNPRSI